MENSPQIDAFFNAYEDRFNRTLKGITVDPLETANAFAEFFVGASPQGVNGGANDQQFLAAIPQGNAFYLSIGTQSMKIVRKEITPIDEMHHMVKVYWTSQYLKSDQSQVTIDFTVTYLLQLRAEGPKIFAYITGDEQKALQENGLVPH